MWTLNRTLTSAFDAVFAPMQSWPGWLSLTVWGAVTGLMAMLAFKYTSNQDAIGQVRDDIKANLLALKLFKDNLSVTFRAQGQLLWAAVRLFLHSLAPFAVMIVPMMLLIFQMSLRYEWRPFQAGETTLLTVTFAPDVPEKLDNLSLETPPGVEVEAGPVRGFFKATQDHPATNEVCWRLRVTKPGRHKLVVHLGDKAIEKELTVSNERYARVCPVRAGTEHWGLEQLLYPAERGAAKGAAIQRIALRLPSGTSPVCGWNVHWIITYFIASMVIALIIKPFLNVRI